MSAEFVKFYRAILSDDQKPFAELKTSDACLLFEETIPRNGGTLLHVAAKLKRKNIAETIMNLKPSLLFATNVKGETPLHIAAAVGSQDVTRLIIDWCDHNETVENGESILRKKTQKEEDTALHRAVRNGHVKVVKLLIDKDPELAKLENKEGDSPLFMAIEVKHLEIARIILTVSDCSFRGRNNMSALHAAVARNLDERPGNLANKIAWNVFVDMTAWDRVKESLYYSNLISFVGSLQNGLWNRIYIHTNRKRKGDVPRKKSRDIAEELIDKIPSELLKQQDNFGWTPLHCAAHMNATHIIEKLLSAEHSVAFITDHQGMTALHVAAKQGHVGAMKKLVEYCPEICDLVDGKERTALHIAAESGHMEVVKFILRRDMEVFDDDLINKQDCIGNTAFHLAASHGHLFMCDFLACNPRLSKNATNSKGLTGFDIYLSNVEDCLTKIYMAVLFVFRGGASSLEQTLGRLKQLEQPKQLEQQTQQSGGSPVDPTQGPGYPYSPTTNPLSTLGLGLRMPVNLCTDHTPFDSWLRQQIAHAIVDQENSPDKQLKEIRKSNIIASTLIATVSFAAAINVPGGFSQSEDPNVEGTAVLSQKPAFRVFEIFNCIAFCLAASSLYINWMTPIRTRRRGVPLHTFLTAPLASFSIIAMAVAFISGSYAVLPDYDTVLAIAVALLACLLISIPML